MIAALLPRFYEVFGPEPTHTILRVIGIDGHEVAWMRFAGTIACGSARGKVYTSYRLHCECDFTEGVGWRIKDGKATGLYGKPDQCLYRKAVLHLRQLELQQEYLKRFKDALGQLVFLQRHTSKIILDLIKKQKAGEFLEERNEIYLQTVAAITTEPMESVLKVARKLVRQKKIRLEGNIVRSR